MGLPDALPAGGMLVLLLASAAAFAYLLARLAWVLPRQLLPGLPSRPSRAHRMLRFALVASSPLVVMLCVWQWGDASSSWAAAGFMLTLLALAWVDAETGLLPDRLTLPLLWAGLLVNLKGAFISLPDAVLGAVAGYLLLWSVYWGFRLLTGKEGMGYGDFKLLAAIGAWVGWQHLPYVLLLSSIAGLAVALILRAIGRLERGEPLSFGPYLAFAGLLGLCLTARAG